MRASSEHRFHCTQQAKMLARDSETRCLRNGMAMQAGGVLWLDGCAALRTIFCPVGDVEYALYSSAGGWCACYRRRSTEAKTDHDGTPMWLLDVWSAIMRQHVNMRRTAG